MEVVQQDRCRSSLNGKVRRKSKMKILKKLKPEERGLTRTLWEQVFTEDTKEFWTIITQKRRRITKSM